MAQSCAITLKTTLLKVYHKVRRVCSRSDLSRAPTREAMDIGKPRQRGGERQAKV